MSVDPEGSSRTVALDPTTTEIIRSKLAALSEEMLFLLYRSAYSTLMRETRDCSYQMTTGNGAIVTDGPVRGQYAIERLLTHHNVLPGDIWIANHPYEIGVQHTPDLMVTVPVVSGDKYVAFSSTVAHKSDSGGALVGSVSMLSTEIYQEGLLLPLMKAGETDGETFELDDRIVRLISANVRDPDLFLGDMRAQIGVTLVARRKIQEIVDRVGVPAMLSAYEQILDFGERMMRRHLAQWPDSEVTVEGFLDSDGVVKDKPVRYELTVTKTGDEICFDFSNSDDQTLGPVNMTQAYMEGTSIFPALLSMTDPAASFNSGMRRPVRVVTRPGTIVNPQYPAPVGATTTVMYRVTDLVLEALSHFCPDRAVANGGGAGGSTALLWHRKSGRSSRSMQYEVLATAQGASQGHDGCSGTGANFYNNPVTPIEILESQFPVRIERFELIPDSGGPGEFRGGLSYRRQYRCLAPATLNRRADRGRFPGKGINGGGPGSLARLVLHPGTAEETSVPIAGRYDLAEKDAFMGEGAGGGGYGDPFRRPASLVWEDVRAGLVTVEAARRDYGVAISGDGVDMTETERLRRV